jgi:protein-S-isoprenylcysteine O-methyltransferase Ste14
MVTEAAAASRHRWALLAMGALVFVAQLTVDAGRARMAVRPDRRSALVAWLSGAWLVVRHPVHALAVGLSGAAAGPLLGLVIMAVRERLPAGPRWAVVAGVLLAQCAAAAVGWGRAVRLAGLARLSRTDQEARLATGGRRGGP